MKPTCSWCSAGAWSRFRPSWPKPAAKPGVLTIGVIAAAPVCWANFPAASCERRTSWTIFSKLASTTANTPANQRPNHTTLVSSCCANRISEQWGQAQWGSEVTLNLVPLLPPAAFGTLWGASSVNFPADQPANWWSRWLDWGWIPRHARTALGPTGVGGDQKVARNVSRST